MKCPSNGVVAVLVAAQLFAFAGCGDNATAPPDASADALDALVDLPITDAALNTDAPSTNPDAPNITLACTFEELQPVFSCAQQQCSSDLSLTCVLTKCGLLLLTLSPSCRQCVFAAATDPTNAAATCIGGLPMPFTAR